MPYRGGTAAIVFGVLGGIGGYFLWTYEYCSFGFPVIDSCLEYSRPYEMVGMLLMVFGGVLFIVGIVLASIGRGETGPSTQTQPVESRGKYCPNCGTLLPFEARFCSACSYEFAEGEG